jgi:spore coat polysaccharide biosynthesis protein SpsF
VNKKTVILIYSRSSSKRLHNKNFYKILNYTLIEIIYLRLRSVHSRNDIFVLTSNQKSDDMFVKFLKKKKINYYRGDLNNVFKRTIDFLKKKKYENFVRITGDSPLVSNNILNKMITFHNKLNSEITSNVLERTFPKGISIEIFKTKIFLNINDKRLKKSETEHISKYFYKNKEKFKIVNILNTKNEADLNLSIDTISDYLKIKKIFDRKKNIFFDLYKDNNYKVDKQY